MSGMMSLARQSFRLVVCWYFWALALILPLWWDRAGVRSSAILDQNPSTINLAGRTMVIIYFEKIRVFKADFCREYISME